MGLLSVRVGFSEWGQDFGEWVQDSGNGGRISVSRGRNSASGHGISVSEGAGFHCVVK